MNYVELCVGGAEKEAAELKKKIQNSENTKISGRVVYYVSNAGSDENNGISPDSPIKTINCVNRLLLRAGDAVLFERGSVFRISETLHLCGGVTYGDYGMGEKPLMLGSLCNYANANLWENSDKECIWQLELLTDEEAGLINFNNDDSIGRRKFDIDALDSDCDFFHDTECGVLYLYSSGGNPGKVFEDIEIATQKQLFYAQNVNHILIDNLCFKYATFGPFCFGNNKEITLSNLEIGWVGGRVFSKNGTEYIRYGNAVEFWYRGYDIQVRNCYIFQVFDAALTFQGVGDDRAEFVNISFEENLIEYCSMNFEFWAGEKDDGFIPMIKNISFNDNIIRFGGYGWGGIQRPDKGDQALILGWNRTYEDLENFTINNNILDCADCNIIYTKSPKEQIGLNVYGNTYYQKNTTGINPYTEIVRGLDILPENQKKFEEAILQFDKYPKSVVWLSK